MCKTLTAHKFSSWLRLHALHFTGLPCQKQLPATALPLTPTLRKQSLQRRTAHGDSSHKWAARRGESRGNQVRLAQAAALVRTIGTLIPKGGACGDHSGASSLLHVQVNCANGREARSW